MIIKSIMNIEHNPNQSTLIIAVGRAARYILVDLQLPSSLADKDQNKATHGSQFFSLLPTPVLPDGKRVPQTSYTSKNFDTARSSRVDSRWVLGNQNSSQKTNKQHPILFLETTLSP
jgi:hypothetical protein